MFLLNPLTIGTVIRVAQVVIAGVVTALEVADLFRDDDNDSR